MPGFDIISGAPGSTIPRGGIAEGSRPERRRAQEGEMETDDHGSVTRWIDALRCGDEEAAQQLWRRYFESLVRLARPRLRSQARVVADEEDVVLSAFDSFYAGMARGRYPDLADRDDLWRLLVTITARKASDRNRWESRQKRGGGHVRHESALVADGEPEADELSLIVGSEPTPEFAAMVAEEYRRLLEVLDDEELQRIATWRLEGYSDVEIAARLGCALRTVARRLKLIRTLWRAELPAAGPTVRSLDD
jgi:DNA-directed RNA polymerase specialized sigma24 family protein